MDYVELHAHSSYSLLDGASHPEELVARAAALGMPALALTDHDAVYGAPAFQRAARELGVRPIFGAELTLAGGHHLTLLVEERSGWHNLCYLVSRAQHAAAKGEAFLSPAELVGCTGGLIALSGCRQGAIATALRQGRRRQALAIARRTLRLFGRQNFWMELQNHLLPGDARLQRELASLAAYLGVGCVATNNVHYAEPSARRLQDVMVCIRHLTSLDACHALRLNAEYYLKPAGEMQALFSEHPEALANTLRLAERCQFELAFGVQELPQYPTGGMSSSAYLRRLCELALEERFAPTDEQARAQLLHELAVIERAGLANYFLVVWDIMRCAREKGILGQGRGSAANSLVAYLLHITPVNPLARGLVFERFLSDERSAVPDIDLDFQANRREEVIQYVYDRYGRDHAAMACTFATFQARSAARDVARALGLSTAVAEAAIAYLTTGETPAFLSEADQAPLALLLELCAQLEGHPRHLGIHSGAMVVTAAPITSRVPTEPATMPGRSVVQWDKDGLEQVGLVKIDLLSLRVLSAISDTLALVEETTGETIDLPGLTYDDPAVYRMIARGDTVGVFQVESRAQTQMIPRLQPRCFEDLVVAISLIRPGPIQANAVHPYLRRRAGEEPVAYLHPLLQPALESTLGVLLFQEQVLLIARDVAGFTPGQGELLRRALGARQAGAEVERLRGVFLSGAAQRDVPLEVAEQIFEQLKAFGSYSFPRSHATAFAVLVYQAAWLKCHHFLPYWTSLLNNQPMGFWSPSVLVGEARRRGVTTLPVDVSRSRERCSMEGDSIRLGLNYVKGMGEGHAQRIVAGREQAPYTSLEGFCRRTRLPRRLVEHLIAAGAMDGWGVARRQLLWQLAALRYEAEEPELDLSYVEDEVSLPALSDTESLLMEQGVTGVSTGEHILAFYRAWLQARGILDSEQIRGCPGGRRVRLAGLMVVHQSPPTAKGTHFVTLEDEKGLVDVVVRPRLYRQVRHVLRQPLLLVEGIVQREGAVSVLATGIRRLEG